MRMRAIACVRVSYNIRLAQKSLLADCSSDHFPLITGSIYIAYELDHLLR